MVLLENDDGTGDRVAFWQCIGCGRIEYPRACIGVCQDRKVDFVYASIHDDMVRQLRDRTGVLEAVVRRLATITLREGEWERSYRTLQQQARQALAARAPMHRAVRERSEPVRLGCVTPLSGVQLPTPRKRQRSGVQRIRGDGIQRLRYPLQKNPEGIPGNRRGEVA